MRGLLSCEICFFRVLRHKVNSFMRLDVTFMQERISDCGYRKWDKQFAMSTVFSKSIVFERQERSNCIAN